MNDNDDFLDLYAFTDDFDPDDIFDSDYDDDEEPTVIPEPCRKLLEGLTMEYAEFNDRRFSSFRLGHFTFYNVTFNNCTFEDIDCQCGKFIACKFNDCNIVSFSGEGYGFRECEFTRCKWSGIQYVDDCFYSSNCKYTDCTEDYDED